jgi:glycosyltransferase involved in cell wall biosynthesis
MTKVTVVIATYNTRGPDLQGVVDSLDDQSLPFSEFEVLFVDDGSTDDTHARLQSYAKTREHFRVHRIPNSGWPGRPRNVGVDMAKGEYVLFMDHDDHLFPEALERMYRFASANGLDVLHPKEVVKGWANPHMSAWRRQVGRVVDFDQYLLSSVTPHKLYRRQFLIDRQVRFPEGRVRLEDQDFNAQAWVRARSLGVLADYPCYQWNLHETNSHKASYDVDVYWASFARSMRPVLEELPPGGRRDQLLVRAYRTQILKRLGPHSRGHSAAYRARLSEIFAEHMDSFPPHIDELLQPADRCRSALLRRQDYTSLQELAHLDHGSRLVGSSTTARWEGGALTVTVTGMLVDGDGTPFAVERVDGRVLRKVPDSLGRALTPDERDLTSALAHSFAEIVVRGRDSEVDWIVPSTSTVDVSQVDDGETITFSVSGAVDPRSAAFGAPLSDEVWDIFFRLEGLGYGRVTRLSADEFEDLPALVAGRPAVAYRTKGGNVSLDLRQQRPDHGTRLVGSLATARWEGGALEISATGMLADGAGGPFPVERVDGRVLRKLPETLTGALSLDERDLTSALQRSFAEIVIRGRDSGVDWIVPSSSTVDVSHVGDGEAITFSVRGTVDPRSAAFGAPLGDEIWDVFFRLEGLGYGRVTRLPADVLEDLPALVAGRSAVAYRTRGGNVSLDVGEQVRTVPAPTVLRLRDITSRRRRGRTEIRVALHKVHVHGDAVRSGTLSVGDDEWPARLVTSSSDGASIIASGRLPRSPAVARTVFDGRTSPPLFEIASARRGAGFGHEVRQRPGAPMQVLVKPSPLDLTLREISGVVVRRGRKVVARTRRQRS